jgi:hypothetical protein
MTGSSGTGKSLLLGNLLKSIVDRLAIDNFRLIFSAQTSSKDT